MRLPLAFKWAGRIVALLLVLFWGAFFVEHLIEWFLRQDHLPPPFVWRAMALHAAMLVGLVVMLKWAVWGSLLTVLATSTFFASIGINHFPFVALLNALPIALLGICFALSRYRRETPNTKLFEKGEH